MVTSELIYPGLEGDTITGQLDPRLVDAMGEILAPSGLAESLGYNGIVGHVVADIGCGPGDYVPLWEQLGAKSVLAIESMLEDHYREIAKIKSSVNIPVEVFWRLAEYMGEGNDQTIDTAFLLNIYPRVGRSSTREILKIAHRILKPSSQLVLTVAEPTSWPETFAALNEFFDYSAIGTWQASRRTMSYPSDYRPLRNDEAVFHETLVVGSPR